jgi:ABC-type uncharacterized transport system ATPase component
MERSYMQEASRVGFIIKTRFGNYIAQIAELVSVGDRQMLSPITKSAAMPDLQFLQQHLIAACDAGAAPICFKQPIVLVHLPGTMVPLSEALDAAEFSDVAFT